MLVSIIVFATAMMTFAMVFPGGFKLNYKNKLESQAAQLCNSIVEEVSKCPEDMPITQSMTQPSMRMISNGQWDVVSNWPKTQVPNPFKLNGPRDNPKGIELFLIKPMNRQDLPNCLAEYRVTIIWTESQGGQVITKTCTIATLRALNH